MPSETSTERGPSRGLDRALAGGLAALTLAIWAPLIPVDLNLADEGWLLAAIDRLVAGERLYADVYRSYAPGLYWFFVPLFRWAEADLLTVRWVWLAGLALLCTGIYRVARPWAPPWAAAAAALLPIFLRPPEHKTFVPLCYVGALWLCRRLVDAPAGPRAIVWVGLGFGLIGLFRQEAAAFGMIIALSSLVLFPAAPGGSIRAVLASALRVGALLGAGAAIVWLPVISYLWLDGALADAVEQLVVVGARGNAAMDLPFPGLGQILAGPRRLSASLFFLPGVATALGGIAVFRARRAQPDSPEALVIAQWTAMAFLSHAIFLSRSDPPHLFQALVAPSLILAFLAGRARRADPRASRWAARIGAGALAVWLLAAVFAQSDLPRRYALRRAGVPLPVPGAEVIVTPATAATLGKLVAMIQLNTEEGEPIFVVPYSPGIYHLANRPNPTRHGAVLPGYASPEIQAEIIAALERSETRLVVFQPNAYDGRPERALLVFAPELGAYLSGHYVAFERIGSYTLLRRR